MSNFPDRRRAGVWIAAALGACIGLSLPLAARAQNGLWMCASNVEADHMGTEMVMGLLGPGLRRTQKNRMYWTTFNGPGALDSATLKAEFKAHVAATYGGDGDTGCWRFASQAEVQAQYDALAQPVNVGYTGAGGLKVTYDMIKADWAPAATAPPGPVAPARVAARVSQGLGAKFQDLTAQAAELVGLTKPEGAVVMAVDTPSEKGLKRLDVLTEIAGQPVASAADVTRLTAPMRLGYAAPVRVWRAGAMVDLVVTLTAPPPLALTPEVKAAVDMARATAKEAEQHAAKAQETAARARDTALKADEAAKLAEQKAEGYGVIDGRQPNKSTFRYAGQTNGEIRTGLAVYKTSNGYVDRGAYVAGELTGLGVGLLPTGDTYEGEWTQGLRAGYGVYSFTTGSKFEGVWSDDSMTQGVATDKTTKIFAQRFGSHTANHFGGPGVEVRKDGSRYEGEFQADLLNGLGAHFAPDGKLIEQGRWKDGKLVEPMGDG